MEYVANSREIVGYPVKIPWRDGFRARGLATKYERYAKDIGGSDWVCSKLTHQASVERLWKDNPHKMKASLGCRWDRVAAARVPSRSIRAHRRHPASDHGRAPQGGRPPPGRHHGLELPLAGPVHAAVAAWRAGRRTSGCATPAR